MIIQLLYRRKMKGRQDLMTQPFGKQSLIEVLTAYKADPNPLTTLAMLTTMATAHLYAIQLEGTPADKSIWLTYDKEKGQRELVTFTDKDQASQYASKADNVSIQQMTFKQIALMVLTKDNPIDSFIVNPETTKAKFNQSIIEKVWQYAIKHV